MQYERQKSSDKVYVGTGWLVTDRTIVTAGHCVYDKDFGRLKTVKATFGTETDDATEQYGTHAVVHWG